MAVEVGSDVVIDVLVGVMFGVAKTTMISTSYMLADVVISVLSSAMFGVAIDIVTGTGVRVLADSNVSVLTVMPIALDFDMTAL